MAWDSREKTFRHEEFEEYKAQRKPMPDLLSEQWPYFAELCAAFGFVNLAVPGYEADDILATLARQAEAEGRDDGHRHRRPGRPAVGRRAREHHGQHQRA